MPLWIEGARNYATTASAALGLTVVFKEKILGVTGRARTTSVLISSWAAYILTVGCSILYQWIAVHHIISLRENPLSHEDPPFYPFTWLSPHFIYGLMMVCFYVGSILLVVSAAQELQRKVQN